MIIEELHIDGFGIFSGYSLEGLGKGLQLIQGNNETGKSTLLKFIRYTLFGYERARDKRMPPLYGGEHGGRIKARLASGEEVVFGRRGDNRKISLTYGEQLSEDEDLWQRLLGHAQKSLYDNMYSFTLDELMGIGSLSDSGMQDKIFSIGLGLGRTSIGQVEKELEAGADGIYKVRGSTQRIPLIMERIDSIQAKIAGIREHLPAYKQLSREILAQEQANDAQRAELAGLRDLARQLEHYRDCHESFILLQGAENSLKELPEPATLPEKGPEKLDKLEQQEEDLSRKITLLQKGTGDEKGIGDLEKAIAGIRYNEAILENKQDTDYLRENLELYRTYLRQNAEDLSRIQTMQEEIHRAIQDINREWTEADVSGFTDMASHRDRIGTLKDELEQCSGERNRIEIRMETAAGTGSRINGKMAAILFSIVFVCAAAISSYYRQWVPGGILFALAILFFFIRKSLGPGTGGNGPADPLENARAEEKKAKEALDRYLTSALKLPGGMSPEGALKILERIEQLRKEIGERDRIRTRIEKERQAFIDTFEEKAQPLYRVLGKGPEDAPLESAVRSILDEYHRSEELARQKKQMEEDLEKKQRDLTHTKSELEVSRKEIRDLLAGVQVNTADAFRNLYREQELVGKWTQQKNSAIQTIETVAGQGKSEEVIHYLLEHEKDAIASRLQETGDQIRMAEDALSREEKDLGEKRGELKRLEGSSELAEFLTRLEVEKQKLQDDYRLWMTHRASLAILDRVKRSFEQEKQPELIRSSAKYFSRITGDRYPKIRVSMDEDDKIWVYDAHESAKELAQLSRGTREQLLTSIRLGFIREYEQHAEPLPVIVDEVLVNYDPERARETAVLLEAFAKDRQLLFFTCHPDTRKLFSKKVRVHTLQDPRT